MKSYKSNNNKDINNNDYNKSTDNNEFYHKLLSYIREQKQPIWKERNDPTAIDKFVFYEVFNEIKFFENDFDKIKNKFIKLSYEPDRDRINHPNQKWWVIKYDKYYLKIEFIEDNQIEVLSAHYNR